jgi:gamma-glutamylcyclotransferase (GGCT)/AIG2-like uncharacterized protein YtfP
VDYPLFVYGTLRSESDHEYARLLRGVSEFVSAGRLRGSLYRVAHYPGWVEDGDPDGWVHGEIWRPRHAATLLPKLDFYEGPEYRRVIRAIDTSAGPVDSWVYLYAASIEGKERIISGDWFTQSRSGLIQ